MFKVIRRIALGLSLGLVVACAGPGEKGITPAEGLALSCAALGKEAAVLAPLRADGTLSASAVQVVELQRAAADPICLGKAPNIDADTKDLIVKNAVSVLQGLGSQFLKQ